ncbi:hypothetical protein PanWU01x14_082640, partial [Parasponia andersonii]
FVQITLNTTQRKLTSSRKRITNVYNKYYFNFTNSCMVSINYREWIEEILALSLNLVLVDPDFPLAALLRRGTFKRHLTVLLKSPICILSTLKLFVILTLT